MISLNLLPDVKKDLLKVRRERNLVISVSVIAVGVSIGVLVILAISLGGMNVAKGVMENSIKKNETTIKQAKTDKQLDKYLTIQNQLAQINGLKDKQMIYSRLMEFLQKLNPAQPNSVSISNIILTAAGGSTDLSTLVSGTGATLTIEGRTSTFASLNVYKNTLQKALINYETTDDSDAKAKSETTKESLFSQVVVQESALSSTQTESFVTFTIQLSFADKAFDPNISNVTLEVPRETTSDGDRNAPKETFKADDKANQTVDGDKQ